MATPAFSIHFGEDADLHHTASDEVFIAVAATRHMGSVKTIEAALCKHEFGDVTVARR